MTICRTTQRAGSNNPENPNKNVCALKVAQALGCADRVRYLHTWNDLKRAANKGGWSFRSRNSKVKGKTVGGARKALAAISQSSPYIKAYVIHVDGHVLLLDRDGNTLVDTAPRKADRRKIVNCYAAIDPLQWDIHKICQEYN